MGEVVKMEGSEATNIKVTNGEIFRSREAMAELLKIELPVKTSWMLVKLASKLNRILVNIESLRTKLVMKHGVLNEKTGNTEVSPFLEEKNEDGTVKVTPNPKWAEFQDEFNALMALEEEINMYKIKIPEEVNGKPVSVSAATLGALEAFIEV